MIKALIFDYGGTLDTNAVHWANVLWAGYTTVNVPITKQQFTDAYIHAERRLESEQLILLDDDFRAVLHKKIQLQLAFLARDVSYRQPCDSISKTAEQIASYCYAYAQTTIKHHTIPVLNALKQHFPLALVSNFYGNLTTVLKSFELRNYFDVLIESAVVGVRKPNADIYALALEQLSLAAHEVVVIGDSYKNDIEPAFSLGCHTIFLEGDGFSDEHDSKEKAHRIIHDISELYFLVTQQKT